MVEPEKPCVFLDPEGAEPELLVSYPEKPRSLAELWTYVRSGLEENNPELVALARKYLGRSECFVDPVWQPSPGVFAFAVYEQEYNSNLYRSVTLTPCFGRGALHLRVSDVTEKSIRLDWEEPA
jgi:hypothetical protein